MDAIREIRGVAERITAGRDGSVIVAVRGEDGTLTDAVFRGSAAKPTARMRPGDGLDVKGTVSCGKMRTTWFRIDWNGRKGQTRERTPEKPRYENDYSDEAFGWLEGEDGSTREEFDLKVGQDVKQPRQGPSR